MALKFDRIQAGEYQVNDGPVMVGYVQKKNSAKWILYKCNNPSLLGNPIAVEKTLKSLKQKAEELIESTYVAPVKQTEMNVDKYIRKNHNQEDEKFKLMREMLENNYVINLNEYAQTEDGLVDCPVSLYADLADEEVVML